MPMRISDKAIGEEVKSDQEAKVEDTAQPAVLRTHQVQIILNPEDSSITQRRLVNIEESIAHGQVRQDHEVDLAHELALLLRINGFVDFVGRVEEGHGDVAVAGFGDLPFRGWCCSGLKMRCGDVFLAGALCGACR